MNSKASLILLTVVALGIWSLARMVSDYQGGKLTGSAVIPFLLIAITAEQMSPRYIGRAGASHVLRVVRVGGALIAFGILVATGMMNT